MKAKYESVYEALVKRISTMEPGERLDSEVQLASDFSVSPMTVRRALMLLSQEGLTEGKPGKGTYVADNRTDCAGEQGAERLDDEACGSCKTRTSCLPMKMTLPPGVEAQLISASLSAAHESEQAQLGLDKEVPVIRIGRNFIDVNTNAVVGHESALLVAEEYPRILGEDLSGNLVGTLCRHGLAQSSRMWDAKVSARLASDEEASLLSAELPESVLQITTHIRRADDGEPTVAIVTSSLVGSHAHVLLPQPDL